MIDFLFNMSNYGVKSWMVILSWSIMAQSSSSGSNRLHFSKTAYKTCRTMMEQ